MRITGLVTLLIVGNAAVLSAQADRQSSSATATVASLSVWTGVAWQTPLVWGATERRDMFLVAVRYRHRLNDGKNVAIAYTIDLLPLIVIATSPYRRQGPSPPLCDLQRVCPAGGVPVVDGVNHIAGIGFAPLGVEAVWPGRKRTQIVGGTTFGVATFNRAVPVEEARKLNVTVTVSGGVRRDFGSVGVLTVGYKFHHLSNAGTAGNPGLDTSVWYVGWARR